MPPTGEKATRRSGFVALVGAPNVGKSTLLNRILGEPVAIVSPRPQTTRRRLLGIQTTAEAQTIWIDTPGLGGSRPPRDLLHRRIVEEARAALAEADVVVVVVDGQGGLGRADRDLCRTAAASGGPWVLCINKIDRLTHEDLYPLLASLGEEFPGVDLVPVSARTGRNVAELDRTIEPLLPPGPFLFDPESHTTETERFLVAEIVREQVFLQIGREIPYRTAVLVESWEDRPDGSTRVDAVILVERASHRKILIGRGGERIGAIGKAARAAASERLQRPIHLFLHVSHREGWTQDPRTLSEMGL